MMKNSKLCLMQFASRNPDVQNILFLPNDQNKNNNNKNNNNNKSNNNNTVNNKKIPDDGKQQTSIHAIRKVEPRCPKHTFPDQ